MKTSLTILVLLALLGIALSWAVYAWVSIGEVEMSGHGYAAMVLGVIFSLLLGGGLMSLVFFSRRRGYEEVPNLEGSGRRRSSSLDAVACVRSRASGTSTTEQLRADIDRGRTGDKVDWPDPAAAPLGTDEEAAGTPTSGIVLQRMREEEISKSPTGTRLRHAPPRAALLFLAIIGVFAGGLLVLALIQS